MRQNTKVPDHILFAASKKAKKMVAAHGSVVKINKIDVLVTHVKPAKSIESKCKGGKMCVFSVFFGQSVRAS